MVNPQMYVKVVSANEQLLVKGINESLDGVVDAGGSGTFETLGAADDALDGGAYSLWVKQGTYAAGLTVSTNNVLITMEPGTVVQAAITLSGDDIAMVLGAGCDIQGVVTLSGDRCSLICQNGVNLDGLIVSGSNCYVNGGGTGTLVDGGTANHAIATSNLENIVENISAQTTSGGNYHGVNVDGNRNIIRGVSVEDAGDDGIRIIGGAVDNLVEGCMVQGADLDGIVIDGARSRVVNCVITSGVHGVGIAVESTGDNSVIIGNSSNSAGSAITLDAGGDNCIVDGNRTDGAITDGSTGSTIGDNDATAF